MNRIKIDRIDKGVNESLDADRIPDNAVVSAVNTEYNNSDTLVSRKGTAVFTDSQNWLYEGSLLIPAKFYVWYAPIMPKDATGEIVYFIFTTSNELFISYEKSGAWYSEQIVIQDIDYANVTADDFVFANGNNKIIIVDNVNKSHFIMFDKDGILVSGKLEYPAPQNKITFNPMTEWDGSRFETTMTEAYLGDCGMYQYLYCYADRFGNLSNPSPISDTYYLDYFEYDEDGDDEIKTDRIQLFNMALPDGLDNNAKDNIEEFYIYRRNVRYTEGVDSSAFELIKVIKIGKKPVGDTDPNNESINSWTDTEFVAEGDSPSYGNIAPVATDAIATAGVLINVGAKTKDVTLWDFKYKCPINLSNPNVANYINGSYIIELHKDYFIDKDENKPFVPNNYINFEAGGDGSGKVMVNREKLLFFDSDLTTPLNTIAFDYDANKIRVIVSIPQLSSGEKTIYFCFTPEADFDNYEGIPDKYMAINVGIDYGAFMVAGYAGWSRQRTLNGEKVMNAHSIVCSDFDFLKDDDVINKANLAYNGDITGTTIVDTISNVPFLNNYGEYYVPDTDFPIGTRAIRFYAPADCEVKYDVGGTRTMPEKGFIIFRSSFDPSDLPNNLYYNQFLNIYSAPNHYIQVHLVRDDDIVDRFKFEVFTGAGGGGTTRFTSIPVSSGGVFVFSWDSEKISLFLVSRSSNVLWSQEVENAIDWTGTIDYIRFGSDDGRVIPYAKYDQMQFIEGTYLSADNVLHQNNVLSMASFMPYFETAVIGLDFVAYENDNTDPNAWNNNIDFEEIEEIEYNNTNRVMWTPVNGLSFNLADYKDVDEQCKRVIVAPYFLQDTYGNSAIIFTRNNIIRFLLDGTPDQWALRTDNFITEYTQYGLLSKNSLGRFGESLFWHSEVGFMRWDRNGIQLISKNRLDIPIKDSIIGFQVPLRNQYIFHDNETNKSWVYHIDMDVWTVFNGLDIDQVQILSGGSDDNNYNLMLTSSNDVKYYPTDVNTEARISITTKAYPFDNLDFYRFRIDFDGRCNVSSTVANIEGDITQSFSNIARMEWNYLNNGSWGETLQFTIDGIDKLKKIEFDINRR